MSILIILLFLNIIVSSCYGDGCSNGGVCDISVEGKTNIKVCAYILQV